MINVPPHLRVSGARLRRGPGPVSLALGLAIAIAGAAPAATPSAFDTAIAGSKRLDGLAPVFLDAAQGRVLMLLPAPGLDGMCARYLYQVYLRASLGSTPVGLDRDQPGPTQILDLRQSGKTIYAGFENTDFRAEGGSPEEQRAVADSFASSTVWSGPVIAEGPGGERLVDITGLVVRDAFGVVDALKAARQGAFHLNPALSYADLDDILAFPENLEFEASQTFASDDPGEQVRGIAPDAHAITLISHIALIKLPAPGFARRLADPRFSTIDRLVTDYAAPLGAPLAYRLAPRFRLEKLDPTAARSRVKKPIVFYVDRAAPEPVRGALIEGAKWWAEAFDAAGFIDAFRVELLPEGVSPLDSRYNVINWVHRQTRGWSYGQGISDPRTGEIIKGSVLLGSQRARQDRMIYEGLLGAAATGAGGPNDPIQITLARLRQLAVHETGHALGFHHNFAGSTYGDRASVMDYPPPRIAIKNGALDFSDAYARGVGEWDRFTVAWLYSQFPPGTNETAALDAIVRDGFAHGLRFVSDDDSRPPGSANPNGALWDDGPDAVAGLEHALAVRKIALAGFGLGSLAAGSPVSDLRRLLVPIYLFHRYELDAVAKLIGGVDFTYGDNGAGHEASRPVAPARQRAALRVLLETVRPETLDLPDGLIDLLSSGEAGAPDPQFLTEVFGDGSKPVFDLPAAAEVAADLAFADLFAPDRLNRVVEMSARDPAQLTLEEMLRTTIATAFPAGPALARTAEIRRRVAMRLVIDLAKTHEDRRLSPSAAAEIRAALTGLAARLKTPRGQSPEDGALGAEIAWRLLDPSQDGLKALAALDAAQPVKTPPGMPIGGEECWLCDAPRLGSDR